MRKGMKEEVKEKAQQDAGEEMTWEKKTIKVDFVHISGPHGDCCSNYVVIADRSCTIKEFLEAILKERGNEWGKFCISGKLSGKYFSDICIEYGNGKLTTELSKGVEMGKVISAKANGGWSMMNYDIYIGEEKEVGKSPKEYSFEMKKEKMENELAIVAGIETKNCIATIIRTQPKEKQLELYERTIKDVKQNIDKAWIYRGCRTIKQVEEAHKMICNP